ncbi:MAG TPA: ATP-binding protein [Smithella sp.]|nr:ATP-binding protein [Smithella sp.]
MDTFVLAATSFTIAVSLMISGKRGKLYAAFSGLCAAVFISRIALFLQDYFDEEFLKKIEYWGLLAVAPSALYFFRLLTRNKSFVLKKTTLAFSFISVVGAAAVLTTSAPAAAVRVVLLGYVFFACVLCYAALILHERTLPSGTEKKRLGYLIWACPIAFAAAHMNFLNHWGANLPVVSGIVSSLLLYFILLIIAYPQLRELHEFFARSLIIIISTLAGAVILQGALWLSGKDVLSFTGLLTASFLIVISLSPTRFILRKIFGYFYPDSQDVFTSLYEFDEKLEKEKSLLLAEMAPVMAHEIRNPLGSIKGAAQYLQSEAATVEQKELLNIIVDGTDRLNGVVSRFLDYARPDQLNLQPQNINAIVKKAVSVMAADSLTEKIILIQELDETLPDAAVDEQRLMQVILNLMLNAVEAMPDGGMLTLRTASLKSDGEGEIMMSVSDTGKGISQEEIKDIFKPFFTTKERGVGLGLAICQKIIRGHGGSIRVQSIPGCGTEFVIRLKAAEFSEGDNPT